MSRIRWAWIWTTGQWWSNRAHRGCCPDPRPSDPRHAAVWRCRSSAVRNRRRCASRESHWRPPKSNAQFDCGIPCGRASRSSIANMPRCRGDLAVSQLSERHRQILIPARQTSVVMIAVVASHTLLELEMGDMSEQIHIIADNYSPHKHPKVKAWLKRRKRFHMHYTPTSASWLNIVERF